MNVVGIRNDNNKIFESQSYSDDENKTQIEQAIKKDGVASGVSIYIQYMTEDELKEYIKLN